MTKETPLERWLNKRAQPQAQNSGSVAEVSVSAGDDASNAATYSPAQTLRFRVNEPQVKPQLHPNIYFRHAEKDNIPSLKRLTSLLLPIPYPDSFYKQIISEEVDRSLTLLAFWRPPDKDGASRAQEPHDVLVGAIRGRLLSTVEGMPRKDGPILYISTLTVLSPYRNLGIASYLLNDTLRTAVNDYGATTVGAHVWETNIEALEWYKQRGFKEIFYDPSYYSKLNPRGARVMSKNVSVLDLV